MSLVAFSRYTDAPAQVLRVTEPQGVAGLGLGTTENRAHDIILSNHTALVAEVMVGPKHQGRLETALRGAWRGGALLQAWLCH